MSQEKSTEQLLSHIIRKICLIETKLKIISEQYSDIALSEYITTEQTCKILQITPKTLRVLRHSKQIAFCQIEKKVLFKPEDIIAYIKQNLKNK